MINYINCLTCDVIVHSCPKSKGSLANGMDELLRRVIHVDVFTYVCSKFSVGMANRRW